MHKLFVLFVFIYFYLKIYEFENWPDETSKQN